MSGRNKFFHHVFTAGLLLSCCVWFTAAAISDDTRPRQETTQKEYLENVKPILKEKCFSCHAAGKQEGELRLDTVKLMIQGGDSGPAIEPGKVAESLLWERICSTDEDERMPPEAEPLSPTQLATLKKWIALGANGPAHEEPQADPASHWSFQPLAFHPADHLGGSQVIDYFIEKKLSQKSLSFSPQADHISLIRRMFLDLHGLSPTPDELKKWSTQIKTEPNSTLDLVDSLLASPRYGERWGQHWLDVIRYADTHGFEVNTPRENAWRYRDYVIEAFNEDKPYGQFILEQLAGDVTGKDVATGFLVAAPVLLPGQIGKDEESKRLARQDSLDEIIVGTGSTFLGLTIGCARCHEHKFDPITQEEYYHLQAFFAGVDYGDREIIDAQRNEQLARADELAHKLAKIDVQLAQYQPLAFPGRTILIDDEDVTKVTVLKSPNGKGTNPTGTKRGYRDDPGSSDRLPNISRGRYTWWDNQPGEDVFTWNPNNAGIYQIWISWGVHGSGVHTRDARYILDYDGDLKTREDQIEIARADQFYNANQNEGDSEKTPRWSGLKNAGIHALSNKSRIILRGGETGTGITADLLLLQETNSKRLHPLPSLREPVNPKRNVERFEPTNARFVRFTTLATSNNNRYEPCLDELEIYARNNHSKNISLASFGTTASSSGDYGPSDRHRLEHINDGKYGNSRSWISNKRQGGWVQLNLPDIYKIDKIVWGRDREEKFKDRLAVRYKIEISLDGESWKQIASSQDRVSIGVLWNSRDQLIRNLSDDFAEEIKALTKSRTETEKQIAALRKPRLIYGGLFRKPDVTHVLNRGDPEQPGEVVGPKVPAVLGSLSLPVDAPEKSRRQALAEWIASSENPLTARVMVNRIWQYHFGTGIVETPSDFGHNGGKPSHPQLLDWLANELIKSEGSLKHIHRLIMNSKTYQQSARINEHAQKIDGNCRLLWRFPSRRLEAEAIRDCMLSVSGNLNLRMYGPGFNFFKTRGGLSGFPAKENFGPDEFRRMIYAHKIRMESVPVFGAFDCPDAGQAMPKRSQSTTAIQALNLLNNPFIVEQAEKFAGRIRSEAGDDPKKQVARAFLLAFGRDATETELAAILPVIKQHGLESLCRVIFNSSEFLYLP